MDTSKPISQIEIEEEIFRLLGMLEEETENFALLSEDAAKKEAKYKLEWAQTYIAEHGSIKERESWADYKTAAEFHDHKVAEALLKAKREKLYSVRTSLDALRTLNANLRHLV